MIAFIPFRDLVTAATIGGTFLALLAVAEWWIRRGGARPEWTRKLVHVGGGLICLTFPFTLQSTWTVLILAVLMSVIFAVGAETGTLPSLHRVARRSRGSEYYPLSVCLLFLLTQGRPWLYVASMLVLAVADACAALIGMRYGRIRYEVESETKSLEGSLAFAAIAFAAVAVPMLTMTDLPAPVCVWSALLVAIVVTGFEAVCLTGTDNLFVPLGTCVILAKISSKPMEEILYQNASVLMILTAVGLTAWRVRALNVGGALVLALFTYGCWSLGSEWWALPALAGFVIYVAACITMPLGAAQQVAVVFRAVLPALLLLVIDNMFSLDGRLYAAFLASLAAILALSLQNHMRTRRGELPQTRDANTLWGARQMGLTALAALMVLALQALSLMPLVRPPGS